MVPGRGPQPAAGMIIGEAPGRTEVERGEPFVGRSGQNLDAVLRALGVQRSEVYVTNVVKEIPLKADGTIRKPTTAEVEAWKPFLFEEILNTAPAAILALGKTAKESLGNADYWQTERDKKAYIFYALHPAALFYKPSEYYEEWMEQIRPWAEALGKFEYPS